MRAALGRLQASGIVALVRVSSPYGVVDACRALCRGGVRAAEITLTVPGALDLVSEQDRSAARQQLERRLDAIETAPTNHVTRS